MASEFGAIGLAECRVRILSASHGDLLPLMARVLLSLGDGGPEPCGRQTGYEKTKLRHPASSSRSARADLPAAIRNVPVTHRFLRRGKKVTAIIRKTVPFADSCGFSCFRIEIVRQENQSQTIPEREYVSERVIEQVTGRKRRTLQKDRLFGRGFPFYRFNRQILYDLDEVRSLIRAGRVDVGGHQ
jgi:hypothetical protein